MKTDLYSKIVLSVIAACLVFFALCQLQIIQLKNDNEVVKFQLTQDKPINVDLNVSQGQGLGTFNVRVE